MIHSYINSYVDQLRLAVQIKPGNLVFDRRHLTVLYHRVGGRYFSKVTSYLLLITSSNVTRYSYILLCNSKVTSNILHISFQMITKICLKINEEKIADSYIHSYIANQVATVKTSMSTYN